MWLFGCVGFGAAVFVDEFGDEKDVVGAGEDGEGENDGVSGGEIVAGTVGKAGCEHYQDDGEDLDCSVDFSQHRRSKTTKAGDDVDGCGTHQNEDVAADDGDCYPERDRKV